MVPILGLTCVKQGYPQFPLDTCLQRSVSSTPAEMIGFTSVYVSISSRSGALRICSGSTEPSGADTQDFCFWRMPEHHAAIQLNLAWSRQEVKRQNIKQSPVTFQNKTLRVDTSTQISKKETNTSSSADPSVGNTFVLLFSMTQTCGRKWSCDYCRNSSASQCQLTTVLLRGRLKTQPVGTAGRRSKTGYEL